MTTARVISELGDAITDWWLRNDLFDPGGVFGNTAIFVESRPPDIRDHFSI